MARGNEEDLKAEVARAILSLQTIAAAPFPISSFGDAYKKIGINYSIEACEIASKITGADLFFCKMMNYDFRTNACELMFQRALAEAA